MAGQRMLDEAMEKGGASRSLAELLDSEAKYRALFSSIDAGFCIVRLEFESSRLAVDYQFLEVNPAFERQTGLMNAEGKWMRSLAPDHEQHWFDIYGSIALTGTPLRFERPAVALQDRWYEVYAFRIGEACERRVAILFNDASQRKRSEAALEQANRELKEKSRELERINEDLEQFARIAGHDLKAPLSNIIQFSQLLERRIAIQGPDGDTREILQQIIGSGTRLAGLVDDLLRYATISQSPLTHYRACRAELACLQALENLRLAIEESRVAVECQIPQDCVVGIELNMLAVVLQNLVGNAITYRRDISEPTVSVMAEKVGSFWRFSVEDNGEGIEERFTDKIFEPFQRLHGQERPGSGIGLATCKRIVERAGGSISVKSRVGEGSTFYFLLPSTCCPA